MSSSFLMTSLKLPELVVFWMLKITFSNFLLIMFSFSKDEIFCSLFFPNRIIKHIHAQNYHRWQVFTISIFLSVHKECYVWFFFKNVLKKFEENFFWAFTFWIKLVTESFYNHLYCVFMYLDTHWLRTLKKGSSDENWA